VQSQSDRERQQRRAAAPGQLSDQRNASRGSQPQDKRRVSGTSLRYATEVLKSTRLVNRPELALKQPDGQYAEIEIFGILDITVNAENGNGNDIAVYAKLAGAEAVKEGGSEEAGFPQVAASLGWVEGFWYGVFAMNKQGEWIALGKGTGSNGPDEFDLSSLPSTTKIRIIFKPHNNPDMAMKLPKSTLQKIYIGIDAVSVLH
jgi:hypothetical protein